MICVRIKKFRVTRKGQSVLYTLLGIINCDKIKDNKIHIIVLDIILGIFLLEKSVLGPRIN